MIEDDATICLTLAGAFIPTGLGDTIISLLKLGFIDFIISTGANLYHDIHFGLGLPVYRGDFRADDIELSERGLVRIYDLFIPMDTIIKTDDFIRDSLKDFSGTKTSAELHYTLGRAILTKARANYHKNSVLAHASDLNVPIYTPSPGDSSIGMNLSLISSSGVNLCIDTTQDVLEATALVLSSARNGVIILGGGAPKNFYMQTQPTLKQVMGIDKGGHDYFIQVTIDPEYYGGLSGATHKEAISWGKINPKEIGNGVIVYCDMTIAIPLIFSYVKRRMKKRKLKRLYLKREEYIEKLVNTIPQDRREFL